MKKRLLCPQLPKRNIPTLLTESEAHHATRVLRLRDGEIIEAMDGKGNRALTTLRVRGGHPRLEFTEDTESSDVVRTPGVFLPLILEMAVLKGEAMEWIVEKSVELGVKQLIPVLTDHTIVQMKNKGPESFRERWQKIADQALKQCGRLDRMDIRIPLQLESVLMETVQQANNTRLWCDETSQGQSPLILDWLISKPLLSQTEWRILIGPEGGWSFAERELLFREAEISQIQRIDLGPNILRAETAALFTISLVSTFALRASRSQGS